MLIPSKQECFYLLEMLESRLVDYSYTHPWAGQLITQMESAPSWLCDLATNKYQGDQTKALREYIFAEPFEPGPAELEKFHIGCLWLRYERRELSWATFLELAGSHLDAANCDWDCETPYHYLNVYEEAYFSEESEKRTKEEYLSDHDLTPWILLAKEKFESFRKMRTANKSR